MEIKGKVRMKKRLLSLMAVLVLLVQVAPYALASTNQTNNYVRIAIKKYKRGNFTGCLQDCQSIVRRDPSNAVAYYYMALAYVQAGKRNYAIKAYSKVLSLSSNPKLQEYATTGKRCLETPDKCHLEGAGDSPALDKFIATPNEAASYSVRQDIEKLKLENVKNEINSGKDLDSYQLNKFRDYSNNRSQADTSDKVSQKKPTNDEIVAAMRVLKDAGINPYAAPVQTATSGQAAVLNPCTQTINYQNPEMAQLNMLLGTNNQSNNNSMLNMLPALAAQNKDGTSNYSPQLMQAVIMNSMMSNFNLDTDKDK